MSVGTCTDLGQRAPRIKSPLFRSSFLLHLVLYYAAMGCDVPGCTAGCKSVRRTIPAAAGCYRDSRANTEQTWRRSFAQAANTLRDDPGMADTETMPAGALVVPNQPGSGRATGIARESLGRHLGDRG